MTIQHQPMATRVDQPLGRQGVVTPAIWLEGAAKFVRMRLATHGAALQRGCILDRYLDRLIATTPFPYAATLKLLSPPEDNQS